ncbi:hypothetical protein OG552_13980 [Streptomyces sp. NBC_01476]|uniref:hypothetical protein n=1 Tax=Streptomyces sp. NBC_01476 TaxID=2903881 RepID=UPI002E36C992|nr:hypothetical protein [Streptomyces sp. NBC_01476]
MPGQGKRKRRRREASAPPAGPGQWRVVFETPDDVEWRTRWASLTGPGGDLAGVDPRWLRIDTFCGRLVRETTRRLSVWEPERRPR